MQSHLAANVCRIEQSMPSRTVKSEPENVLNTLSPGRSTRWILPHELETPNRPTSSGLQSPMGAPIQFGPSPQTREYTPPPPCHIPPAQWGDVHGRAGDERCELFSGILMGDDQDLSDDPLPAVQHPDGIGNAAVAPLPQPQQPLMAARCVNGSLVRPDNAEEEPPSTACRQSAVMATGGVKLGRGSPGQQQSPGGLRGRAPPCLHRHHLQRQCHMLRQRPVLSPIQCSGLHCILNQRQQEEAVHLVTHPMVQGGAAVKEQAVIKVKEVIHRQEEEPRDFLVQEEGHPPHQEGSTEAAILQATPHHSRQEEQDLQAVLHNHLQGYHSLIDIQTHGLHQIDLENLYRSSCYLPITHHASYWT